MESLKSKLKSALAYVAARRWIFVSAFSMAVAIVAVAYPLVGGKRDDREMRPVSYKVAATGYHPYLDPCPVCMVRIRTGGMCHFPFRIAPVMADMSKWSGYVYLEAGEYSTPISFTKAQLKKVDDDYRRRTENPR